ncbi:hypothetical protein PCANC_26860 [Puccinia coronata f. sp. avenae]|uniref:Protein kinase domain-containing protein n=1 Tax=Puccinia coronata f. sp. avenae TaxID=200324 RepID=A0A2N5TCT7_9BASI|nr:hypothetical protein PCANC_26860 [Puccinia coronata f. sp. avenae]
MNFVGQAQKPKESLGPLRTPHQTVRLPSLISGAQIESSAPPRTLGRHSMDSLSASIYNIKRRYSGGLARSPALYYSGAGQRDQMMAVASRATIQSACSSNHQPALPQIIHRNTISTMDPSMIHRRQAGQASQFAGALRDPDPERDVGNSSQAQSTISQSRPRNLVITTEFSSPESVNSPFELGLPQEMTILITKNFDVCYFINLPRRTFPASIVDKIFSRFDIPTQERSDWSIFRAIGVQPVGHALDPEQIWEECNQAGFSEEGKMMMFIILPCNPELMSSHLKGLLNPPEYQETVAPPSHAYNREGSLSGLSSDRVLSVFYEEGDNSSSQTSVTRRVSFKLDEDTPLKHKYPVTPPIRLSELANSPTSHGNLQASSSSSRQKSWPSWPSPPFDLISSEYSPDESTMGSSLQYGGGFSPRLSSTQISESPSLDPPSESIPSQKFPRVTITSPECHSPTGRGLRDDIEKSGLSERVLVERNDTIEAGHSIRSIPSSPDSGFSSNGRISAVIQPNLLSDSCGEIEDGRSSSDSEGSYSSCSSSEFPHIGEEDNMKSPSTSHIPERNSLEPKSGDELSWFNKLMENCFKPLGQDLVAIPPSLTQDLISQAGGQQSTNAHSPSSSSHESRKENTSEFQSSPFLHSPPENHSDDFRCDHRINQTDEDGKVESDGNGSTGYAFEVFRADSVDIPLSDGVQIPMDTPLLTASCRMTERHLPPYDKVDIDRSAEDPLETCIQSESNRPDCFRKATHVEEFDEAAGKRADAPVSEPDRCWATRPAIEKVYNNLEKSFPNHNIDQPIEVCILKRQERGPQGQPISSPQRVKRVLSIRSSVRTRRQKQRRDESPPPSAEPLRCDELQLSPGESDNEKYLICSSPRNSLKLWGFKTEEILPGVEPDVAPTSSSSYEADLNMESSSTCLKWVKGELIGCGSFGSVYLALNLTNQEMMAVKQVKIGHQSSTRPFVKSALEAIKLEICFLKDLEHPNVVQFLGFEETSQNYNIFLEYVEGGSIGSCVSKNGKLEPEVVKSFTKQILKGLEYLHSCCIMHRDLKADNVLVNLKGKCKISDFGISKRSNEAYLTSQYTPMQGTVFSMAPEMFNQPLTCRYSAKSDIWSLGCLVLEMLCGLRAWHGYGSLQIIYKVGIEKCQPKIPEELLHDKFQNHFLNKCLEIKPSSRPTASRLIDHLFLELDPEWEFEKSQLFKLL